MQDRCIYDRLYVMLRLCDCTALYVMLSVLLDIDTQILIEVRIKLI